MNIPTLMAIGVATTSSIYMLQDHQQDVTSVNSKSVIEGYATAIKNLSPNSGQAQCGELNADFAKNLPQGARWMATVNSNGKCDTAKLSVTLPDGNNPATLFANTANAHVNRQTISWQLSQVDPVALQTPYQTRLQSQVVDYRVCNKYRCGGINTGVDITPPIANFIAATDNIGSIQGHIKHGDNTDDNVLELSGSCEQGSSVDVYNGTLLLGEATLTETEMEADVKCQWIYEATVENGTTYLFNVRETDWVNNISAPTTDFKVTGDTEAPTILSFVLADHHFITGETTAVALTFSEPVTGFDKDDITVQSGTLSAMSSDDKKTIWTGTFTPSNNVEAASNQLTLAKSYTDTAGNTGTKATSNNYTVDTKAPTAPNFTLNSDSGIKTNDNITNDKNININAVEQDANWEYSLNGGGNWHQGSGTSFQLAANTTYQAGNIKVRQTDKAGNISVERSNSQTIITDNRAPVFTSDNATSVAKSVANTSMLYQAKINDNTDVIYSLGGTDASLFSIAPATGNIRFNSITDKHEHNINVIGTDAAGNATTQALTIYVNIEPRWEFNDTHGACDRTRYLMPRNYDCIQGWNNGQPVACNLSNKPTEEDICGLIIDPSTYNFF